MTTRTPSARWALAALGAFSLIAAFAIPSAATATVTAKLRVLTPDRVLDPGTTYIVDEGVTVPTRPDADCFGAPGGSGAEFTYERPNALSLLATAGRTTKSVAPLSLTDQFGFGLGICGIGGVEATMGEAFWYYKANHEEAAVAADELTIDDGDEILFYLAPEAFPNPNPAELELIAPPRAKAGEPFAVSVVEHKCVSESSPPFAITCTSGPATGVSVSGGDAVATTGPDGSAQITVGSPGEAALGAARGADIPSETLATCVAELIESCPAQRGISLVGSPRGDRVKGTAGSDSIRSRGGDDKLNLRQGGADSVNCGKGRDTVKIRRADADALVIKSSCERVQRR
jgi:Ca2+-binding RTX toxin-like protein